MKPLLTVGMPIYNSMPYLPEAMEGLLAQTCGDFNILAVVDDCSDGSIEYIESIRDARLQIIRRPRGGLTSALNCMLREAKTPWLVRQDSDDVSYPNRIERILAHIGLYPDTGVFHSDADYHPKDLCVGQFRCTRGTPKDLRRVVQSGYLLTLCHPSTVLNIEKALSIGGYRESVSVEDADMWWRMALQFDIRYIPEALVGYRHNPFQSTRLILPQAVNGLYVQYLLLSQLWDFAPESMNSVEPHLRSMISLKDLQAKEHLRNANILLSQRKYPRAIGQAIRSMYASPDYFFRRLRDEFRNSRMVTNGVDPAFFLQRKADFWPSSVTQ